VVLVGPPNAGKSRLFNVLVGRDRAIVSPQAGTTRDYLTALCDCDGITVELVDTAGIDAGRDDVEAAAQEHGTRQLERADVVLDCWPPAWGPRPNPPRADRRRIGVQTRCDEAGPEELTCGLATSALTGEGIDCLRSAIAFRILNREAEVDLPAGTAARCRGSILRAEEALRSASASLLSGAGDELVAFDVRLAAEELGKVVGAVVTDDILDRIFRRFCIGK
jgi:tRNA modification GTPase